MSWGLWQARLGRLLSSAELLPLCDWRQHVSCVLLEQEGQEYKQVNRCVEVLLRCLVEDVLMVDDVGHPASRGADILVTSISGTWCS